MPVRERAEEGPERRLPAQHKDPQELLAPSMNIQHVLGSSSIDGGLDLLVFKLDQLWLELAGTRGGGSMSGFVCDGSPFLYYI